MSINKYAFQIGKKITNFKYTSHEEF